MSDEDDVPAVVEVLSSGPIKVSDLSRREELVEQVEERLEAILEVYRVRPTPEGWRELALMLLADQSRSFQPWIEITTPAHRGKGAPGAPAKDHSHLVRRMQQILEAAPGTTAKAAAERVAGERKRARLPCPSVKNLQRIWTEHRKNPRGDLPLLPWLMLVNGAFEEAASRIEAKSKK